jgi:hypothetical protein
VAQHFERQDCWKNDKGFFHMRIAEILEPGERATTLLRLTPIVVEKGLRGL